MTNYKIYELLCSISDNNLHPGKDRKILKELKEGVKENLLKESAANSGKNKEYDFVKFMLKVKTDNMFGFFKDTDTGDYVYCNKFIIYRCKSEFPLVDEKYELADNHALQTAALHAIASTEKSPLLSEVLPDLKTINYQIRCLKAEHVSDPLSSKLKVIYLSQHGVFLNATNLQEAVKATGASTLFTTDVEPYSKKLFVLEGKDSTCYLLPIHPIYNDYIKAEASSHSGFSTYI